MCKECKQIYLEGNVYDIRTEDNLYWYCPSCEHSYTRYYSRQYIKNQFLTPQEKEHYDRLFKDKQRSRFLYPPNLKRIGRKRIPLKIKQMVYEDNIKRYGTLTCYLCSEPIEFGKDTFDHIIPVCKGGSDDYSNLAIAHRSCNSKKNAKYLDDFLKAKEPR
jgi:5-methylcytosine-specific restriction endonuclease McrA